MTLNFEKVFYFLLLCALPLAAAGQVKKPGKPKTTRKAVPEIVITPPPAPSPSAGLGAPKTNKRPGEQDAAVTKNANGGSGTARTATGPVYLYKFTRPGFLYSPISIEHDDTGKGTLKFLKI